jgi:hypothetical protein
MATRKLIDWTSLLTGLLVGAILGIVGTYSAFQNRLSLLENEVRRLQSMPGVSGTQQSRTAIKQSTQGDRSPAIVSNGDININQNNGKDTR